MRKTIIITGAGSGIGAATTKAFLDDGYHVGLIGRRAETLEATANGHKNALILPCDVADPAAVDSAFATRWRHGGGLTRCSTMLALAAFQQPLMKFRCKHGWMLSQSI